jgi:hypothetical protein
MMGYYRRLSVCLGGCFLLPGNSRHETADERRGTRMMGFYRRLLVVWPLKAGEPKIINTKSP